MANSVDPDETAGSTFFAKVPVLVYIAERVKSPKKSFRSEIQDGRHFRHLESLFFASSPESKGQLTRNLVGSIGVTCTSKITKIVPIVNPRWLPWPPS